jgi:glycosyltransferase involved in cell wall biosynthesis
MLNENERPTINIYIITYRRHWMLRRAIKSVQRQTYRNIAVKVVNDDPEDQAVVDIIKDFADERISLFLPVQKRGATQNFNLAFSDLTARYVSILEDDNWWEPTFLEEMFRALAEHQDADVAVGNQNVWKELGDKTWQNTGKTIWALNGLQQYSHSIDQICGSAKICNSSMLVRLRNRADFKTPDNIPVDVTEHFRERVLPTPILLLGRPLVNYAETLQTARSSKGNQWAIYQVLLIGSIFIALPDRSKRRMLADNLWQFCVSHSSPRAVSLASTGLFIREARSLLTRAPLVAKMRFLLWAFRRPHRIAEMSMLRKRYAEQLHFLVVAPLTQYLARL